MIRNLDVLPDNLPAPIDDGACAHLEGSTIPEIQLTTTSGRTIDLKQNCQTPTVLFFYPRTGEPNQPAPADWDLIPGARGCTPQSCGFRNLHTHFKTLGYQVFGVSTQTTAYQQEFVQRNHIPFEILSDADFVLTHSLKLPTFEYNGLRLLKRMAWVVVDGKIKKCFYPVFPPDKNATTVLAWLKANPGDH